MMMFSGGRNLVFEGDLPRTNNIVVPPLPIRGQAQGVPSTSRREMSDSSSSSDGDDTWINWYCGLEGHEVFCQVDRGFIQDSFNLFGLRSSVSNINDCLEVILDRIRKCENYCFAFALLWQTCCFFRIK